MSSNQRLIQNDSLDTNSRKDRNVLPNTTAHADGFPPQEGGLKEKAKKYKWWILLAVVVLLLAIILPLTLKGSGDDPEPTPVPPPPPPPPPLPDAYNPYSVDNSTLVTQTDKVMGKLSFS